MINMALKVPARILLCAFVASCDKNLKGLRAKTLTCVAAFSIALGATTPAHALLGLPSIVFDPSNLAQNVLTAARTLAMINNQIRQLANDAQMLTKLDKHLLQLGFNVAPQLKADLDQIKALMQAAHAVAFQVHQTEITFQTLFPKDYTVAVTSNQMVVDAQSRWNLAQDAWHDTMVVQAQVVEQLPNDIAELNRLVTESQSAEGQLQATQAGNQLTAMNAKQQMQMAQLMAAQFRAEAFNKATASESEAQARESFRRFLGSSTAYVHP